MFLFATLPAKAAETSDNSPFFRGIGIVQHLGTQVPPDLSFRDSDGKIVRLGDFFDGRRPIVLTLVYFKCPMLCTVTLNQTLQSLNSMTGLTLGKDYQVLTVSFDPREKPELAAAKKAHYVAAYQRGAASQGWHFLTGDEASIKRLTDVVGFHYRYDSEHQQYIHPAGVMVLTPEGKLSRYFYGVRYAPSDLRLSLVEASHEKVGSLADEILLLCCSFDPTTGRYDWAVRRILNVGGALTILILGIFIYRLARNHRRSSAFARGSADSGSVLDD